MLSCLPTCYMWRSKDDFQDSVLSFEHLGSRSELRYHTWPQVPNLLFPQTLFFYYFFLCLWNLWQDFCFSLTCTGIVGVNHDLSPNLSIKKAGESCLKPHSQRARNPDEPSRTYRELGGSLDFRVRDDKCLLFQANKSAWYRHLTVDN